MKTRLLGALLLVAMPLAAQQPTPRELFERARILEESNRNLDEAVALYGQVAAQSADRELAATALLRVGLLHERQGRTTDAQRTFQSIVAGYAEQAAVVQQARSRIRAGSDTDRPALGMRQLWAGPQVDTLGSVSPDGRSLTFVDWSTGDLAVRDLGTDTNRRLTKKGSFEDSPEFALYSRISPDGRLVAYYWHNKDFGAEIRVGPLDGSSFRVVASAGDGERWAHPEAWSPDGRQLVLFVSDDVNRIAVVDAAGGSPRTIRSFDWRAPGNMRYSPDGKYIAYDFPPVEASPQRDLFILAADGSRELHILEHPADDSLLAWMPGGIVFASDRSGTMDAWTLAVADGKPQGVPALLKKNLGNVTTLGTTAAGSLYYGLKADGRDVYTIPLDSRTGTVSGAPTRVPQRFVGTNFEPDWSPDGRRLAYASERALPATRIGAQVLSIADIASGVQRDVPLRLGYVSRPRWSPDGRSILLRANDGGKPAFVIVDVDTARTRTLVRRQGLQRADWSADGRTVFTLSRDYGEARAGQESWITALDVASGTENELFRETATVPVGDGLVNDLAVSPDGTLLAFTVIRNKVKIVAVMSTGGGDVREIFRTSADFQVPNFAGLAWMPDGKELVLVRQAGSVDSQEAWALPAAGGMPRPLGLRGTGLRGVRPHPDGRQLTFQEGTSVWEVWALDNVLPAASSRTGRQTP